MVSITTQRLTDEIKRQQKLSENITNLVTQISTGTKINKASDDPQAWVQISEIGRAQAQQSNWSANADYAQSRYATADSAMDELSTLLVRARELVISASSPARASSQSSIAAELDGVRESINQLLSQKDASGLPVFDSGQPVRIPVANGYNIEAVPTVESLTQGISVGGAPQTLDNILSNAVAAINSGDSTALTSSLDAVNSAGDHIATARTLHGIRGDRIDKVIETLETNGMQTEERRMALQDTDLATAIAQVQANLLSLQAAQTTYTKISQQSLFDLIR
ncbi:MAG: flagellin [Sphingobium sp.]|nr:flagellin [Sphingobium sp.]